MEQILQMDSSISKWIFAFNVYISFYDFIDVSFLAYFPHHDLHFARLAVVVVTVFLTAILTWRCLHELNHQLWDIEIGRNW